MPPEVKFRGFEILKTHIQKVRIINNSDKPQRLIVLAPSTPNFKIKYGKKAKLPPGIGEDIYV